jgi:energy-coupling factor transport system permease protein
MNDTNSKSKKGLKAWTTRDLLVTVMIGIIFGLILAGAMNLTTVLQAVTSPLIASALLMFPFVMAGVIAPYIIRRPGAAILSELISGLVMIPFTPFGFVVVAGRLIEGIVYESPFLITRYKKYGWLPMIIGGALGGTALYSLMLPSYGGFSLKPAILMGVIVLNVISSAAGGALAKALSDAIAKTGVLNSFAIGKEQLEEI